MEQHRLQALLDELSGLKIGLLGDLFLDRYLEIETSLEEMSIETGLPAHQVTAVRNSPGALGTVVNNLVALGVRDLQPISVIGDDGHGDDLLRELHALGVRTDGVLRDSERLTPTYTKPLQRQSDGSFTELRRLDVRTREPLAAATQTRVINLLQSIWSEVDGWIVLDQMPAGESGVVAAAVRTALHDLAACDPDRLVFVDSRANIGAFSAGLLKMNHHECFAAADREASEDLDEIKAITVARAKATGCTIVCTCGERGMVVAQPDGETHDAIGYPAPPPVDFVGAGDSATAGMVCGLLAGGSLVEAATLGNLTASITVQQLGCTGTATPNQILRRFTDVSGSA